MITDRRDRLSLLDAYRPPLVRLCGGLVAAAFPLMNIYPAYQCIDLAVAQGIITPDSLIVESSSGTMALGLAIVCRCSSGYKVTIVSDPACDPLVQTRLSAAQLVESLGRVDCLVGTVGSGRSVCGTANYLRTLFPELVVIGVDTLGSVLFGQHHLQRNLYEKKRTPIGNAAGRSSQCSGSNGGGTVLVMDGMGAEVLSGSCESAGNRSCNRECRFWFLLSNTTGTGRLFAQTVRKLGPLPVLLASDPTRHAYALEDAIDAVN